MLRPTTLALALTLLAAPLALGGCAAQEDRRRSRAEHDVPSSLERARLLEERAIADVAAANDKTDLGKRREYYDRAIAKLEEARELHTEELINDPGGPEEQRLIEQEIRRLDEQIAELHRVRPAVQR